MYLVNFPSISSLFQQFIAADRFRTAQGLLGPKNSINTTFTLPSGEKFTHNLPFLTIHVYYNGVRLALLDDYTIQESGGVGSGYDTVILEFAPRSLDHLFADYIISV